MILLLIHELQQGGKKWQLPSNQIKKVLVLIREIKPEICVSGVKLLTTGKMKLIKFIIDLGTVELTRR